MPPLWAIRARRVTDAFAATICALLARASLLFISGEWEAGSLIAGFFPAWIFQSILPIGFALMGVRFLAAAILGRPSAAAEKNITAGTGTTAETGAAAEKEETP